MVSVSPRLRDSLDYEEPDETDPRLSWGFRSLSINSAEYEDHEPLNDHRLLAGTPDPSASRRKRRQRKSDQALEYAVPFQYRTIADGDAFRLCVVLPGTGTAPLECRLIWESSKAPRRDYFCISYCWETIVRDAAILLDGYRFPITKNLLSALRSLRKPRSGLLIWADQICINQSDDQERGHQVSIMKRIFNQAKEVIVWLGEEDDRSRKLCEYARKMKRGEDSPKSSLNRILSQRQLQDALQKFLQRPWFQRVWVVPEVALARFTTVACGKSIISWDNLVRLIRDTDLPSSQGFDKQAALLGNARQRIAIITQMIASQREGLLHTDITQLLILAKSSKATDVRDMVFAFYGVTLLTTFPDYTRSVERLYCDIAHMYINSILYEDYYSRWHRLSEQQRIQQLTSILYSAGSLHQHYSLPSWVPDHTYAWHLTPIWAKTNSNVVTSTARDEWSAGIRCDYRAGGDKLKTFEVIDSAYGMQRLRLSVLVFDSVTSVSETTPASTPHDSSPDTPTDGVLSWDSALSYGRAFFDTDKGLRGVASRGIQLGDVMAVVLGGDVPVVLRPWEHEEADTNVFKLLCESFVTSPAIMNGELVDADWTSAKDIMLI